MKHYFDGTLSGIYKLSNKILSRAHICICQKAPTPKQDLFERLRTLILKISSILLGRDKNLGAPQKYVWPMEHLIELLSET